MNNQYDPADDLAAAQEEAAKLRVFDAAHKADEPHWDVDGTPRYTARKRLAIIICLAVGLWIVIAGVIAAVAL